MPDILRGTIERITYHNEENGYTVAQLQPDGAAYMVAVIGNMLGINVGESVAVTGVWTSHAQYGRQFKADTVKTVLPATIAGLIRLIRREGDAVGGEIIPTIPPIFRGHVIHSETMLAQTQPRGFCG